MASWGAGIMSRREGATSAAMNSRNVAEGATSKKRTGIVCSLMADRAVPIKAAFAGILLSISPSPYSNQSLLISGANSVNLFTNSTFGDSEFTNCDK